MRRMARVASLLLAAVVTGCGGTPAAAVWLRIEAPLVVPTDCDAVRIQVQRADVSDPLLDKQWSLDRGPEFPLELSLVEDDAADLGRGPLEITVEALKGGMLARAWSRASVNVELVEGQMVERTVELCDCEAAP